MVATSTNAGTRSRYRNYSRIIPIAIFSGILGLVIRQVLGNLGPGLLIGPDWRGPIFSIPVAESYLTGIFHDLYFGTDFPFGFAEISLALLAKPNPELVNLLLILLPIPLSALSAYFFVIKRIKNDPPFATVAAVAFAVNPLTVSRIYSVELLMLWVYALVPLFFLFILDYKRTKSILAGALTFNVMFALRPQAIYIVGFVVIGLVVSSLWPPSKFRKAITRDVRSIARALTFFGLTTLAFNGIYLGKIAISNTINPTSTPEVSYLYSNASPESIFRLVGEPSFYHSIFGYYDLTNALTVIGIVLLLGLLALAVTRAGIDPKIRTWSGTFLFIFVLLSIGYFTGPAWDRLIASSTITGALRNPNKFLFGIALPFSLLVATGFEALNILFHSRKFTIKVPLVSSRTIAAIIVIALILFENYPLITANLLSPQNQISLRNSYWFDPSSWNRYDQVSQYISNYRTLVLPFTYEVETAAYNVLSGYQIVSAPPAETGAKPGAITYWTSLLDSIANGQSDLAYQLKIGGIRYLIVDENLAASVNRPIALDANNLGDISVLRGRVDNYLYMDPSTLIQTFNSQRSLRYLGNFTGLQLFENEQYSGKLFGASLAYSADSSIINDVPLLLNSTVTTSDPTIAPYTSVTIVNATTQLSNATIQLNRPQIFVLADQSLDARVSPTIIEGNLAITNVSITYSPGQAGWKTMEIDSPYTLSLQPSGVNDYNIFYKASGTGWTPMWTPSGFNDISLNGQSIPMVVYKPSLSGSQGIESYSIGALGHAPPAVFNYTSSPGEHKGFRILPVNSSFTLALSFSFVLTGQEYSYGEVSFSPQPGLVPLVDITLTSYNQCQIGNPTLLTPFSVYQGRISDFDLIFQNVTLTQMNSSIILMGTGLANCLGLETWVISKQASALLQQRDSSASVVSETTTSFQATVSRQGLVVLVLAYAFDPSWKLSESSTVAHFSVSGMNGFLVNATSTTIVLSYSEENYSTILFEMSGAAAMLLVALLLATNRGPLKRVEEGLRRLLNNPRKNDSSRSDLIRAGGK